ncbi:MAG TPA: hypothetical protein P5228_03430 [Bacteroidales bacterium]|nr:hypothetical protein [Bacteroidales bacterium]HRZ47978.1 hypothetical protein [Bacteroidales bacterium]
MKSPDRYPVFLSLLTGVVMAMLYIIHHRYFTFTPAYTWWLLPLAFYVISLAGHTLLARAMRGKPDQFMVYFLLATTVKMLLYLGLLLIWFFLAGKTIPGPFIGAFALLYLSVTVLDLGNLLKKRNRDL